MILNHFYCQRLKDEYNNWGKLFISRIDEVMYNEFLGLKRLGIVGKEVTRHNFFQPGELHNAYIYKLGKFLIIEEYFF